MKDDLAASLYKAAALTFEKLGFLLVMPEIRRSQEASDFQAAATIEFRGIISGRLIVAAYGGLIETLTANMLGEDENESVEQQWDALGEVANVICGNVLPLVAGSREVFHIATPKVSAENPLCLDAGCPTVRVELPLEQGYADVAVFLEEDRPSSRLT